MADKPPADATQTDAAGQAAPSPIPSIEPDLSRAPPPPAWKPIKAPPPLPGVPGQPDPRFGGAASGPIWAVSALGFEFVCYVVACLGIGWLVDSFASSHPWGKLIGAILGIVFGGYRLIKGGLDAQRRSSEKR